MYAVPHSFLMALHEDRLREAERSAGARKARQPGRLLRLRRLLGLSAGRTFYPRSTKCPAPAGRTMIMVVATTGGCAEAARQN